MLNKIKQLTLILLCGSNCLYVAQAVIDAEIITSLKGKDVGLNGSESKQMVEILYQVYSSGNYKKAT